MNVIAHGRTAEILAWGDKKILKLYRAGIPEHLISAEYRITSEVFQSGIMCPEPIETVAYEDRQGIVYARIDGMTMLQSISRKMWSVRAEGKRMARLHRHIHQQGVSNKLPSQKQLLSERMEQTQLLTTEEKRRLIKGLQSLREDNKLCHGDFHPDNIILGAEKEWVIDWMTGMAGNPAGDVARTYLLLKCGTMPQGTPKVVVAIVALIRRQLLKAYMKEYLKASELTMEEINQWIPAVAAARLTEWLPEEEKSELVKLIRQMAK